MNDQAKHTRGPWAVEASRFCDRIHPTGDTSVCIAQTGNWLEHEKAEQHANAHLIAAAPDLLAALQSLMPNTLIGESYDPPVPADELLKEFLFTWGKLRAARTAIAKALGQDGSAS